MSTELVHSGVAAARQMVESARGLEATLDIMSKLVNFGCLPKGMKPGEGMLCASMGHKFGWNPLEACQRFHVINGSLSMKADVMVGVVKGRPDLCRYFRCVESTDERATFETHREGAPEPERETFTMADAKRAQVTSNKMWGKYPRQMLRARASAALARMVYPDILAGIYSPDEMDRPDIEVGDIIDATYTPTPQRPASVKTAQVEHVADEPDTLMGFIEAHDLAPALELYMAAKSPKGAECGLTVDAYNSLPKSAADSALGIMREVYGDGDVNAMWAGAQVSMTAALDRDCTKADTDALATRIASVNASGADRRAQVIAAALMADHCVRNPSAVHLRLGLPKVAEKGGEA